MHISDGQAGSQQGETQYFTGEVWMDQLAAPGEQTRLSMLRVHFSPGARTNWHTHPSGQILHVVDGVGRIQARGEEVRTLRAGDTAVSAAGEWHWHGAASNAMMTMISVQGIDDNGAVVRWGEPVADLQPAAPHCCGVPKRGVGGRGPRTDFDGLQVGVTRIARVTLLSAAISAGRVTSWRAAWRTCRRPRSRNG